MPESWADRVCLSPQSARSHIVFCAILLAFSLAAISCAGRQVVSEQGTKQPTLASEEVVAGSLQGFESAVYDDDPVPGADVYERVTWAVERAQDTTNESYDAFEAIADIHGAPPELSPVDAASGWVEMATVLGTIAATPSPNAEPVSIERRRRANKRNVPPGHLHLRVARERKSYDIKLYDNRGRMQLDAVIKASRALRDQSSQIVKPIDPRLLAMLYLVGQHFDKELEVVSGYRVRGVNASKGSRHGFGKAADFRISGVNIYNIAAFAESTFAQLGMGVYPTSGFVHMDTRRTTFYWRDNSGPNQRTRTRARSIDRRGDPQRDPTLRSIHMTEHEVFTAP